MKTVPDIIDMIVRPSPHDTPISIIMMIIAMRMVYGGAPP